MRTFTLAIGLSALAVAHAVASSAGAQQKLPLTPPQTEGPYYPSRVKPSETDNDLTRIGTGPVAKGDAIDIKGVVVDPEARAIANARIEIWQTDAQGIYLHPGDSKMKNRDMAFQFYGQTVSDAAGAFSFRTIIPARYPGRARHIHVKIHPPGGPTLTTQLYFRGDDDLRRDGPAAALGKALESVTLAPVPNPASGRQEGEIRFVVRRAR